MATRKTDTLKKENEKLQKAAEKAWQEKILKLLSFGTVAKALNATIKALKKELVQWVMEIPTGHTENKYPYRQAGKVAGVLLQDNPQHKIDINALIGKIGLVAAVRFLSINRTSLVAAIKAKEIPNITLAELAEITKTTDGESKVIPYYGTLDISQVLSIEEE